jgi:hypothetical protein
MSWQEDLIKKEKELKLKEVTNDGTSKGDSGICDRGNSGRRSNVNLSNIRKKELKNLRKGGIVMIPAKGIWDDFKAIDANDKLNDYQKLSLKLEKIVKLVLNCRTNSVRLMDKMGIPRDEAKKEENKQ